jgi:hypothetical protein
VGESFNGKSGRDLVTCPEKIVLPLEFFWKPNVTLISRCDAQLWLVMQESVVKLKFSDLNPAKP